MILFDLDGTLVDTAPDLGYALNLQRELHGLAHLPMEVIRPFASHGSKGLLNIGFGLTPEDLSFEAMRVEYLDLYDQVFTRSPLLFDGVGELLSKSSKMRYQMGCGDKQTKTICRTINRIHAIKYAHGMFGLR
jgi:phosphoglycolate phosphatase